MRRHKDCELVYFTTQCRGVKFYHFRDGGVDFGDKLAFVRKPHHFKDPNCVEVRVVSRGRSLQLGHVAAEAAEWLLSSTSWTVPHNWVSKIDMEITATAGK